MRKLCAMVGALVLTASVSYGQGQEVTPDRASGSKALLFEFGGLSTLAAGDFDGGAGLKYFLSESTALRASLQLSTANADVLANPVAPNTGIDGSQSATLVGFSLAVEQHMGTGRVSPYLGAGISWSTEDTESTNVVVGNPPGAQTTVLNRAAGETIRGRTYLGGRSVGLFGLMGFEFFLRKEVSLSGEYRLGYESTDRRNQGDVPAAVEIRRRLG